jgi:DNA-binding transcriptional ArsR family regulator
MVQCLNPSLDLSFSALSDATRRGIIDHLGRADASITALAEKFHMTLTGMKKHVAVLERAGLVITQKVGRVRTCRLGQGGLEAEVIWIEARRKLFEARFDALDQVILDMNRSR